MTRHLILATPKSEVGACKKIAFILYQGQKYTVAGINNKGKTVTLKEIKKVPSVKKVQLVKHVGGWRRI